MSSSVTRTSKYVYKSSGGTSGDVTIEYGTDLGALTRLEDKLRLLQEDLDSERELRQRIERERSDLQCQLIAMSDRLEEAEGGAECQIEMNKKRDTELSKLRKLLEDVHLESEETAHHLRKKHQEAIAEFQEQLDAVGRSKAKAEKEKQKFQSEVFELLAQVENVQKEKMTAMKTVEKLETTVYELNIRIEELNRTIVEVTSQRSRLSAENAEYLKEIHELKVTIDNVNHLKTQLATQLEESRRRLEEEERRRCTLENTVHTLEIEIESYKVQLDEEAEFRLELERQLAKANADAATYKSRYEAECQAHIDEVEDLRRKMAQKIAEYEEQLEALLNRCSSLEKQKSRLQSEVEVLIMDLEKATAHAQALEKRVQQLEKLNMDLKAKLEEVTMLMEQAQRDARQKAAELAKLQHDYEKLQEQKDALARENKKLEQDLQDARSSLADANRRMHEMEIEIKRLENERDELSAAYKESESLRKSAENRCQMLQSELQSVRHEYEKRLLAKEEELEALRKQYQIEVETLNMRLADAEAKLKTEVARLKKKFQAQITELEMSLDVANKQNLDLQRVIKKQALQIQELQSHYDEVARQLQQTLDQLGVSQRRCQGLQAELDEQRVALESSLRSKRVAEQSLEEATVRINELTTINVNIASAKSKIEGELGALQADYDELHKELRVVDERLQRTLVELKSTKDILVEEQEKYIKVESIKKSLEVEVRTLQVRIEEVEANALAGGKRVIGKLEARIRDIELELDEEKKRHAETQKVLRKKDHRGKELLVQTEEDNKTIIMLNDTIEKLNEKVKVYKRNMNEQEGLSQQNLSRVRRFQRELEAAEDRAENAEGNLSLIRAKHRSWVTTSQVPGGTRQVFVSEETTTSQF